MRSHVQALLLRLSMPASFLARDLDDRAKGRALLQGGCIPNK
jgi:hypothetical protein